MLTWTITCPFKTCATTTRGHQPNASGDGWRVAWRAMLLHLEGRHGLTGEWADDAMTAADVERAGEDFPLADVPGRSDTRGERGRLKPGVPVEAWEKVSTRPVEYEVRPACGHCDRLVGRRAYCFGDRIRRHGHARVLCGTCEAESAAGE